MIPVQTRTGVITVVRGGGIDVTFADRCGADCSELLTRPCPAGLCASNLDVRLFVKHEIQQ